MTLYVSMIKVKKVTSFLDFFLIPKEVYVGKHEKKGVRMRNILGKFLVRFLSMVAIFLLVPITMMADKPETVVKPPKPEKLPKVENNILPISDAGEDQSVLVDNIVNFDGSDIIDPDGTIKSYEWMEDETVLSSSIVFVKSDFSVGLHTITLTVTDNKRVSVSDSMVLTITTPVVSPPIPNIPWMKVA